MPRAPRYLLLAGCLLVLASSACKKSPCERRHPPPAAPTFPWATRLDLVPPGSTVCGVDDGEHATLRLSFPKDDNPFVTIVRHLESNGWSRAKQGTGDKNLLTAELRKGSEEIRLMVERESGNEDAASLTLTDLDCFHGKLAKDGTSCAPGKPERIVRCADRNRIAWGPQCAAGERCVTDTAPGSRVQGETARCFKLDE